MGHVKTTADEPNNVNPCYEIDPDGDVTLVVHNIPLGLPADLKDVPLDLLAGNTKPQESTTAKEKDPKTTEDADSATRHLQLRVSSKHLSLACPHFARMFRSELREGIELRNNGRVELEVDQPSGTAVLLLMLVIHGRTRQVPRAVSKDMLVEIAVLVDYYECYEAVEVFSDMWIAAISDKHEKRVVGAPEWIFISWVFSKKTIFNKKTFAVINSYKSVIGAEGLPLPARILVVDRLNEEREKHIQSLVDGLHDLHTETLSGCYRGSYSNSDQNELCSYSVLGALTKRLVEMKLSPKPTASFPHISPASLLGQCKSTRNSPRIVEDDGKQAHDQCRLNSRINLMLQSQPRPQGLDLNAPEFRGLHPNR